MQDPSEKPRDGTPGAYLRDQHWRVQLPSRKPAELKSDMLNAIIANDAWRFGLMMQLPYFWTEQQKYLEMAAEYGRTDMLRALTDKNPSWKEDATRHDLAEIAIDCGKIETLRWLVEEKGLDVNGGNGGLLSDAAGEGHAAIVDYLIEKGANAKANDGYALVRAAEEGHLAIVKKLVAAGVPANCDDGAALNAAIRENRAKVAEFLLRQGVTPGEGWREALLKACAAGSTDIAAMLFAKSADIESDATEGLLAALEYANYETAGLCLQKGGKINAQQGAALRAAVIAHDPDTVKFILDNGGDPNIAKKNETPLMAAARRDFTDIVTCLLERGADHTLYNNGVLSSAGERKTLYLVVAFIQKKREEKKAAKSGEFNALFGGSYSIDDLRRTHGPSGETGLVIAAQTGRFSALVRKASGGQLLAADLYFPDEGLDCVFTHLFRNKNLRQFFEGDLWRGRADEFTAACDMLPESCRHYVDRNKLVSQMNLDALRNRTKDTKRLKP